MPWIKRKKIRRKPLPRDVQQDVDELTALMERPGTRLDQMGERTFAIVDAEGNILSMVKYDLNTTRWYAQVRGVRHKRAGRTWHRALWAVRAALIQNVHVAARLARSSVAILEEFGVGATGVRRAKVQIFAGPGREQAMVDLLSGGRELLTLDTDRPEIAVALGPLSPMMLMELGGLLAFGIRSFYVPGPKEDATLWGFVPGVTVVSSGEVLRCLQAYIRGPYVPKVVE